MFRRTPPLDADVVAAAQRRLAALVQQHSHVEREGPTDGSDAKDAAEVGGGTIGTTTTAPGTARHLGARRTEQGRWGVSPSHVTVAALAVVVLIVAAAWWSLRSVPHSEQVQLSSHGAPPPTFSSPGARPPLTPAPASLATPAPGQASVTAATRLVVDVAGKVRHPGIVELPAGSRVVDALAAAGGAKPGVGLTTLNLARPLVDGEQIVVGIDVPYVGGAPSAPPIGGSATTPTAVTPVNLNTATAEQLDTLPGVGPVTAQEILAWRTDNGPFTSVDELLEVSGIGDATLSDLRPYVYV